jgi:hypothetical protein
MGADRRGQARIRPRITQFPQLIQQRRGPQMRVIGQPDPAVHHKRRHDHRAPAGPPTRLAIPAQIRARRLAVMTQVPGDRRDRPAPPAQRLRLHIVLPREHPAPKIVAMMITATIPEKQPKRAQARPGRDAQVGKLI